MEVADSGPGAPELPGEGPWGGKPAPEGAEEGFEGAVFGQGGFELVLAVLDLGSAFGKQEGFSRIGAGIRNGL